MDDDERIKALLAATAESAAAIEELLFIVRTLYGSQKAIESDMATQHVLSELSRKCAGLCSAASTPQKRSS